MYKSLWIWENKALCSYRPCCAFVCFPTRQRGTISCQQNSPTITTHQSRGSEVIKGRDRTQKMAHIPWAAQMSATFMEYCSRVQPSRISVLAFFCCVNYIWLSPCVRAEHRCRPPPPTVSENMSRGDNHIRNYLPRLSSELVSQRPLKSIICHYNTSAVRSFIIIHNKKKYWEQPSSFIIVVIPMSPLKYHLSKHTFLPLVRSVCGLPELNTLTSRGRQIQDL